MQSVIVIGEPKSQDAYISQFILDHEVPSYAITKIEGVAKIDTVHQLVKASRLHTGQNEKRVIIFFDSPTIPAQNSLLKYLEELPESDYVFFLVKSPDLLLETICSRCRILRLEDEGLATGIDQNHTTVELLKKQDIGVSVLQIAQSINSPQEYEELLRLLRNEVVQKIIHDSADVKYEHIQLLKYLLEQNQYVQENNVNPKLTIESFLNS